MLKLLLCNITGSLDLIFTDVQKFQEDFLKIFALLYSNALNS